MGFQTARTASDSKPKANKLVLAFAALAATAVIGTTGVAAAQTGGQSGNGYGGGNTNNNNISLDLNVNGNNNTVNVIINFYRSIF
jgi:hypothetical protein